MIKEDLERINKRGPADLEERLDQLQKQKNLLKLHCKKSGERIKELERDREILKKEIDRLSEQSQNFETMLKSQ